MFFWEWLDYPYKTHLAYPEDARPLGKGFGFQATQLSTHLHLDEDAHFVCYLNLADSNGRNK